MAHAPRRNASRRSLALMAVGAGVIAASVAAAGCEVLVGIPDVTLVGGTGPCARAPDGGVRAGPDMVRVDAPGGSYCIDTTEVTVAQFNAFDVATNGVLTNVPAVCSNAMPTPPVDPMPEHQNLPIGDLGECHAWAYCQWAGKRLCGVIGDGGTVGGGTRPQDSEWTYACINGAQNLAYPYGETYDPLACNLDDPDGGGFVPVKSRTGCHGVTPPFDQIYDMVGNAWEFVNDLGSNGTAINTVGGSWSTPFSNFSANGACHEGDNFDGVVFDFAQSGFRCCADVVP